MATLNFLCLRCVSLLSTTAAAHNLRKAGHASLHCETNLEWELRCYYNCGVRKAVQQSLKSVLISRKHELEWKVTFRSQVLKWVKTLDMLQFVHTEFGIDLVDIKQQWYCCRILKKYCRLANLEMVKYFVESVCKWTDRCSCDWFVSKAIRAAAELPSADIAIYLLDKFVVLQMDLVHRHGAKPSIFGVVAKNPSPLFEYLLKKYNLNNLLSEELITVTELGLLPRIKAVIDICNSLKTHSRFKKAVLSNKVSTPAKLYALSYYIETLGPKYIHRARRMMRFPLFPDVPDLFHYWINEKLGCPPEDIWPYCLREFAYDGYVNVAESFHKRYAWDANKKHIDETMAIAFHTAATNGNDKYIEFLTRICDKSGPSVLNIICAVAASCLRQRKISFARWLMAEFHGELISYLRASMPSPFNTTVFAEAQTRIEILSCATTSELMKLDLSELIGNGASFQWPVIISPASIESNMFRFVTLGRFDLIQKWIVDYDLSDVCARNTISSAGVAADLEYLRFLASRYDFKLFGDYCELPLRRAIETEDLPVVYFFTQFQYPEHHKIYVLVSRIKSARVMACVMSNWNFTRDQAIECCFRAMLRGNLFCLSELIRRFSITVYHVHRFVEDHTCNIFVYEELLYFAELALDVFVVDDKTAGLVLMMLGKMITHNFTVPDQYRKRLERIQKNKQR